MSIPCGPLAVVTGSRRGIGLALTEGTPVEGAAVHAGLDATANSDGTGTL